MTRSTNRIPKLRTRGRENRRRLMREAQRLMLRQPGAPPKFSDVFEAAGVSRGSAYRIYIGIDDLLQDIATEWVINFVDYLRTGDPGAQPESWAQISDFIVQRGAEYWTTTADTIKLLPRLRASGPDSYRLAVRSIGVCAGEILDRYFVMPEAPDWSHRLCFFVEMCDLTFSAAVRWEGRISEKRVLEAQILGRTCLALDLPADLPKRQKAS